MQLIENASEQKLRGGYYTPPQIAAFLLQWGMSGQVRPDILEPVVVMGYLSSNSRR